MYIGITANLFQCTNKKAWKDIAAQLGIGPSSSGAYTLKKHYGKNLLPFECHFERGGIDPGPILSQVEAQSKKKGKAAQSNPRAPSPGSQVSNLSEILHWLAKNNNICRQFFTLTRFMTPPIFQDSRDSFTGNSGDSYPGYPGPGGPPGHPPGHGPGHPPHSGYNNYPGPGAPGGPPSGPGAPPHHPGNDIRLIWPLESSLSLSIATFVKVSVAAQVWQV